MSKEKPSDLEKIVERALQLQDQSDQEEKISYQDEDLEAISKELQLPLKYINQAIVEQSRGDIDYLVRCPISEVKPVLVRDLLNHQLSSSKSIPFKVNRAKLNQGKLEVCYRWGLIKTQIDFSKYQDDKTMVALTTDTTLLQIITSLITVSLIPGFYSMNEIFLKPVGPYEVNFSIYFFLILLVFNSPLIGLIYASFFGKHSAKKMMETPLITALKDIDLISMMAVEHKVETKSELLQISDETI